jgi:hypothetical protein
MKGMRVAHDFSVGLAHSLSRDCTALVRTTGLAALRKTEEG